MESQVCLRSDKRMFLWPTLSDRVYHLVHSRGMRRTVGKVGKKFKTCQMFNLSSARGGSNSNRGKNVEEQCRADMGRDSSGEAARVHHQLHHRLPDCWKWRARLATTNSTSISRRSYLMTFLLLVIQSSIHSTQFCTYLNFVHFNLVKTACSFC